MNTIDLIKSSESNEALTRALSKGNHFIYLVFGNGAICSVHLTKKGASDDIKQFYKEMQQSINYEVAETKLNDLDPDILEKVVTTTGRYKELVVWPLYI